MRRRGAVIIVSVLVVAFALIGVSYVLTTTYLSGFTMPKTGFREAANQIASSSRGAVAMALADVTKNLNLRAKSSGSSPYLDWDEMVPTSDEENHGVELIQEYQTNMRLSYPSTGLVLNFTNIEANSLVGFYCNWTDTTNRRGYSVAKSNVSIDLRSLGFRGLTNFVDVEINSTINNLIDTDGRVISYSATFVNEGDSNLDNIDKDLMTVYLAKYNHTDVDRRVLTKVNVTSLTYAGGMYLVTCTSDYEYLDINLGVLTTNTTALPDADFESGGKESILDKLYDATDYYNNYDGGDRSETWLSRAWARMYEVRVGMDPDDLSSVISSGINATEEAKINLLLGLVEVVLGQLQPTVRMVATDFRGITVSAYGACGNETAPPIVLYETVTPGVGGAYTLTATGDDTFGGGDYIKEAEYGVSGSSNDPPDTWHSMSAVDGSFNEPIEDLTVSIPPAQLGESTNYIWIRVYDAKDECSDPVKVKIASLIHLDANVDIIEHDRILMQGKSQAYRTKYWVEAKVRVLDEEGHPVVGARVRAHWSVDAHGNNDVYTDSNGYATLISNKENKPNHGSKIFMVTVDSVTKSGYSWVEAAPSDTLRLSSGGIWSN